MKFTKILSNEAFAQSVETVIAHSGSCTDVNSVLYATTQPKDPFAELSLFKNLQEMRRGNGLNRLALNIVLASPTNFAHLIERSRPIEHMGDQWRDNFGSPVHDRVREFWSKVPVAQTDFSAPEKERLSMIFTAAACNTLAHEIFRREFPGEVFALADYYSSSVVLAHNGIQGAMALILPFDPTEDSESFLLNHDSQMYVKVIHPANTLRLPPVCFGGDGNFTSVHLEYIANQLAYYMKSGNMRWANFRSNLAGYHGFYNLKGRPHDAHP